MLLTNTSTEWNLYLSQSNNVLAIFCYKIMLDVSLDNKTTRLKPTTTKSSAYTARVF